MVSWTGDGLIAGYDPITSRLKADLYHLATPGSVDLQGVTRLNFKLGDGLSTTLYPNKLQAKAPIALTSADFAANPGKYLGPVEVVVAANAFSDGYVPTPSELLAAAVAGHGVGRFPDKIATSPVTRTYTFQEVNEVWSTNNKYWVLIYVASWVPGQNGIGWADIPPMLGANINVIGRAVSVWANRTPAKPTITSPPNGFVALAGTTFDLSYNPNDPDEVTPSDAKNFNADVIGVEVQCAAAPSVDNPNPPWVPFNIGMSAGGGYVFLDDAWYIRGAYASGTARLHGLDALVDNLGFPVRCGALDRNYEVGRGELPTGEWQIRLRTFDYGHPYPSDPDPDNILTSAMPGPIGVNPATTMVTQPATENYPPGNVSPWSDPVRVVIPAQVPPPIPLAPTDNLAVPEGTTVRMSWKYRNTHQPPRGQYQRVVQIREVGDPDWATVFNGVSGNTYVDLPPVFTPPVLPPISLLADPDFELGTKDGWDKPSDPPDPPYSDWSGVAVANVLDAAKAHSGSRSLICTNNGLYSSKGCSFVKVFPSDTTTAEYVNLTIDGWVWIPDPSKHPVILVNGVWRDSAGNIINDSPTGSPFDSPYQALQFSDEILTGPGYVKLSDVPAYGGDPRYKRLVIQKPINADHFELMIQVAPNITDLLVDEARLDDLTVRLSPAPSDSFSISATNQYEWQVQATDTDGVVSNYNTPPARFWVVPAGASGEVRPVPSETTDGATLGCGTHRVEVYRRGGRERVGELTNLSHVDWDRVRDDISTAQIEVSGWDVDCGNLLSKLQTWAYELVIFRDNGYSTDRVWEGPITLLTYEVDKVTIDAKDVMGYAYRRIIKQKMTDSGTGNGTTVVDRARRVLQNTLAPDDPNVLAYLQVLSRDDDAMQYRSTPAYSRTAFEEIDDMAANAGLDYTVVGRSIMLWGTKHRIGTLPEFKDEDLGSPPIVSEYGMSMANRYAVSDGNGVWGEATRLDASGNDEVYGLVEMLSSTWASDSPSDSGTYTQAGLQTVIDSFKSFAERSISDRYPPPVVVRVPDNTTLNPSAVISIQHLVPGVVIPLRSSGTLRTVMASQKLDSVKVVEEAGKETVSITLSPFSSDDAALVDGDA
jgi:hypothetical protein